MALFTPVEHKTSLERLLWERRIDKAALGRALVPPVHKSTVGRWCNGERNIPAHRVEEIAALLGVLPGEII